MIQKSPATASVSGNRLFPIFIKLEQFHVLVVGGGFVGMEKLSAILKNSPETTVTIVSKKFIPAVPILSAAYPKVQIIQKEFDAADLDDKDFVIAATNNRDVNRAVKILAEQRRILANVADTPELCDFYLSSVVQKGDLKIAISTNGKSPTVAKRIKETLIDAIPDEIDDVLQRMTGIRNRIGGDFAAKVKKMNEITEVLAVGSAVNGEAPAKSNIVPQEKAAAAPSSLLKNLSALDADVGKTWKKRAMIALAAFSALLLGNIITFYYPLHTWRALVQNLDSHFYMYILTGFVAEFFATLSCASMFIFLIGVSHWQIILGLILGSIVAAPIAARLAGKLPLKTMFFLVGSMVIFWSLRIIWQVFHS